MSFGTSFNNRNIISNKILVSRNLENSLIKFINSMNKELSNLNTMTALSRYDLQKIEVQAVNTHTKCLKNAVNKSEIDSKKRKIVFSKLKAEENGNLHKNLRECQRNGASSN